MMLPAIRSTPPSSAQALIEARAPALVGALIGCIAALVFTLFGWLAWAEVEEVVRAAGRVEPAGRVKIVNHPRGGRVVAVHVREGEQVEAGAPLLTLDGEIARSERAELLGRWQVRSAEVARLEAEASGIALQMDPVLADERPDLASAQATLLEARAAANASKREALAGVVETRRSELRTAAAEIGRLRNSLALAKQQAEAVQSLADRGLYPTLKLVQMQRQLSDTKGELAKADSALTAAKAAVAESESRLMALESDIRSAILAELAEAAAERDRLAEQLRAQHSAMAELELKAVVGGVVQELAVSGPGQAVAAHETLMKIVPLGEQIVVEARVANEDIGRLRPGMPATLKIRAFDYLRYGSLDGTVQKVAADASPEPGTGELAYNVTVTTAREHLGAVPGELAVVPGMVVDVELKVGERTILSYLTDQIVTWGEAFREG